MWDFDKYDSNLAIIDDCGLSISYSELSMESSVLYGNIGGRCLIFILCRNSIGSLLGYVSAIDNRVVPLLLNADLDSESIERLIASYQPNYLWVPNESIRQFDYEAVYSRYGYSLLKTGNPDVSLNADLALLLTTSGSTGSPKFVRQSYKNIESNTKSIVEYLKIGSSDRAITTLPMNYTYGLSIINTHLFMGATLLMTEKTIIQKEFWSFFKQYCATTFGGVPYTYEILHKLRFERMDLPSLRYITQAGGKLSKEMQRIFASYSENTGVKFVIMYGQCEATARMSYLPPEEIANHLGSIGIPIPGGRFKIISDNGNEINDISSPGELEYIGPNVTMGYSFSKEDLFKGDERNGTLLTGDIAQFDENGFYYIVGRKKRFLKVFGNRINLDEIEQMLKDRYVGIDCAVAGIDDDVRIFVARDGGGDEMRKFLSSKTGLNVKAFSVIRIEQIPKNDSGKILYDVLNRDY